MTERTRSKGKWRSKLRPVDVVLESWIEVTRHPGRAILTGLGVALGSAAIVATLTLVATIRFQVSDDFDARLATQVELRSVSTTGDLLFPPSSSSEARVAHLRGVEGVALVRETFDAQEITLNQVADPSTIPTLVPVFGINPAGLEALEATITGPGLDTWHNNRSERVALLSRRLLVDMGVSDVDVGDRVFISGLGFTVVGILEESPRLPILKSGAVVPLNTLDLFPVNEDGNRLIAVTDAGAATQIANVLPVAFDPTAPQGWVAYAPVQDDTLRRAVDDRLQTFALGLGAIVMALGIVSITNATLTSVLQRIREIGLRRALGARPRHVAAHILLDAATIGAIGGLVGAALGVGATLVVTSTQGWIPVVDPRIPLAAIAGGMLSGILAGIYPARIGSRLQPTDALRRE
jgi:putative ABC transport system permease protein